MNVIIVDDEPLALDVLETYIENVAEMHLVGKTNVHASKREPDPTFGSTDAIPGGCIKEANAGVPGGLDGRGSGD